MPFQLDVEKTQDSGNEAPKYQNTYRLAAYNPFKIDPVDKIVQTVMVNRLEDISYNAAEGPKTCQLVATEICKKINKLSFDRYKIVVSVSIIEKASQSLNASVGFLWDADKDNYSTFAYEARTFYAHCSVFGLYFE